MTYCPIYKDECPENAGMCTFWNVTIIPGHNTKKCKKCGAIDWDECDYCDGYVEEKRIEGCTLKTELRI
jgi:hypothetical protein